MRRASTRPGGVLHPHAARAHFQLVRHAPADDLSPWIERHWTVRWDLRGRPPHVQETLPHPCVNVAITEHGAAIYGCETRRSGVQLTGEGRVFGTKFRPGAFFPFLRRPLSQLTDRSVPLREVFGPRADELAADVLAVDDDAAQIALVEAFLRELSPRRDTGVDRVIEVVQLALDRPAVARVEDLAELAQIPARTLQRLFRRYVGVSPKWVIRCFRLHEAAERLAAGRVLDGASLAAELGYFDQAHFIRDFKALIGSAPSEYAARCAAQAAGGALPASGATTSITIL
ncbi:helix-turn-helix domain-containing protein [Nannocystis sp. SCPEA4]|jgi:AraC-like DNA-binding protein|uniref:AraC family transcriptional regulator n=1 Tax=Nannocystis sp. SCPEA4 TaxID=2996787 RepID=UPI002270439C|nr:helix-turn-helix domain-containing protein [Nannocystis sp. SCPEA4]MCY1061106.1 helix-turn-helix domain-containing protein [Nannocystis sp. SCPEA4]